MRFGLKEEIIKNINSIFSQFQEIEEAVLYGSRAKGNQKNGSDIDITLKGEMIDLKLLNKISLKLDDLNTPYRFDVSIYHHITNHDLLEHINRVGKTVYCQ